MLSGCSVRSNGINGFITLSFMPSLVKMGQQCCGSTARLFHIGGIQEGTIKILTLIIPIWCTVVSGTTWDGSLGCFDRALQKS